MLVITERREIGEICGHRVYEVSKSEIISLRISSVLCNIANSSDDNRFFYIFFYYILPLFFFVPSLLLKKVSVFFFLFGEKRLSACVHFLYPSTFL